MLRCTASPTLRRVGRCLRKSAKCVWLRSRQRFPGDFCLRFCLAELHLISVFGQSCHTDAALPQADLLCISQDFSPSADSRRELRRLPAGATRTSVISFWAL